MGHKDGKASVKMQREGIRGEEDDYGMGAVGQSWHSQAFVQLRKITAAPGVSGGGSEGSASFQKAELHKVHDDVQSLSWSSGE